MADDNNKCAHEICQCAKATDSDYCGEHCEDADDQDLVEITCDCGHPGCS
ncbi:MAG: hypothetical protein ACR2HG_09630 [Pyrinomonadaceae bacterium]